MKLFNIQALAFLGLVLSVQNTLATDWVGFRGNGTSVSSDKTPPTKFSDQENVAWKASLPGKGLSSPIVVGDRVIVTCSSGTKEDRLHIICFDTPSGKQLWERQFWATGRTLAHPSSAVAANTAASDGKLIFAFFSSNDLFALDLNGNLRWFRGLAVDYPSAGNDVGMSSSVVVANGAVVVQSESQGDAFVLGVNSQTGETLWRVDRTKEPNWASPTLAPGKKPGESVVLLTNKLGLSAHDPLTGSSLWFNPKECDGISSCVVGDDAVYVVGNGLRAVKTGTSASPEVLWSNAKLNAGAASPVAHAGRVYTINRAGVLTAADTKTGESLWQLRLKGQFWATPVIAGDTMFVSSKEGLVQVVDLTQTDKSKLLLSENKINGEIYATPALSNGALYIRTGSELLKIAETKK